MPLPALARIEIAGDAARAVARLPARPGVAQLLAGDGSSLLIGTAASLRRWAAGHLGLGKPGAPGRRPRTNLAPVAAAIAWVEADAPFRQRLVHERLMASLVPLASRRDLKPPAFLHLDPAVRFPRVGIRGSSPDRSDQFGPFRDRRAAERARDALHRLFPLRPCDYVFEPDPELPLGTGCVFAQVRSCAAPCLGRVSEDGYRALAASAAAWLADAAARGDEGRDAVPPLVGRVAAGRALVVDAGRRAVSLYPVLGGRVAEDRAVPVAAGAIEEAVAAVRWEAADGPDDWPWLLAWMRGAKARASFLPVGDGEAPDSLTARVRAVLPPRFGDNVGRTRGQP